ncbi:segregation and condensation protein A [Thiolapillus sp.]
MSDENRKERDIMMVMRKVLANIIKDTTPEFKTMKHPLSANTIEDIRQCLRLIAAREQELAKEAGEASSRPYFTDEKPRAEVIPISKIGGLDKKEPEE